MPSKNLRQILIDDYGMHTAQNDDAVLLDGELTAKELNLSDTVFEDLRVPVTATRKGGTRDPDFAKILDDGSSSQGVFAQLFDGSVEEELYFMVQIPHSWKQQTALHPHVHWLPVADGSAGEKVSWGLEYTVAAFGEVFGNTSIIYGNTTVPDETLVANTHYITNLGSISMSGVTSVSAMLICRIFRDTTSDGLTDDYGDDAALLEIDFHYEINNMGSRSEFNK